MINVAMFATSYGAHPPQPLTLWGAQNYLNARGGIDDTAQVLAKMFDQVWGIVAGTQPFQKVPSQTPPPIFGFAHSMFVDEA